MTTNEFKRKVANKQNLRRLGERLDDLDTIIRLMNKHGLDCSKIVEMREEDSRAWCRLNAEINGYGRIEQ